MIHGQKPVWKGGEIKVKLMEVIITVRRGKCNLSMAPDVAAFFLGDTVVYWINVVCRSVLYAWPTRCSHPWY